MNSIKEILLNLGYSNIADHGKEFRAKPIYRDSSNNTSLSIRKDNGRFIDFSLGISGSFEDLIKLSLNLSSVEEAQKWLNNNNISFTPIEQEKPKIVETKIFDKESLLKLEKDHSYWIKRGVPENIIKIFEGGVALKGKLSGRYVFPIFNGKDQIIGFSGRDLVNDISRPKWKHIGNKSKWCYPLKINRKSIITSREIFIVESIGDMLSLYSSGVENTIVSFGLDISVSILNFLLKCDLKKIYISFNNDEAKNSAGNEAAEKIKNKLSKYFDSYQISIKLPSKKDFGEMNREEILEWKNRL